MYMVMELCLGGELFSVLNNMPQGRFKEDQVKRNQSFQVPHYSCYW